MNQHNGQQGYRTGIKGTEMAQKSIAPRQRGIATATFNPSVILSMLHKIRKQLQDMRQTGPAQQDVASLRGVGRQIGATTDAQLLILESLLRTVASAEGETILDNIIQAFELNQATPLQIILGLAAELSANDHDYLLKHLTTTQGMNMKTVQGDSFSPQRLGQQTFSGSFDVQLSYVSHSVQIHAPRETGGGAQGEETAIHLAVISGTRNAPVGQLDPGRVLVTYGTDLGDAPITSAILLDPPSNRQDEEWVQSVLSTRVASGSCTYAYGPTPWASNIVPAHMVICWGPSTLDAALRAYGTETWVTLWGGAVPQGCEAAQITLIGLPSHPAQQHWLDQLLGQPGFAGTRTQIVPARALEMGQAGAGDQPAGQASGKEEYAKQEREGSYALAMAG